MKRMKKAQSRQDITIREAFEQFQIHNQVNNLAKDTIRYYAQKSEYFFAFIGNVDVSVTSVTPELIESYILDMKKRGNLSDATINNRLRWCGLFSTIVWSANSCQDIQSSWCALQLSKKSHTPKRN